MDTIRIKEALAALAKQRVKAPIPLTENMLVSIQGSRCWNVGMRNKKRIAVF